MIRIADRYLATRVLLGCGAVTAGLLTVYLVLSLVDESGSGSSWSEALRDSLLALPSTLQRLLPAMTLLGAALGLGYSARHHELIVLRGAGLSPLRLACGPMLAGLLIGALGLANAHWLLPLAGAQQGYGQQALWVPMGEAVVRVERMPDAQSLRGVSVYQFSPNGLQQVLRADSAQYQNNGRWRLQQVQSLRFADGQLQQDSQDSLDSEQLPQPEVLRLESLERGAVGLGDLLRFVADRRAHGVPSPEAEVRLAALLMQPVLLLALLSLMAAGLAAHASRTGLGARLMLLIGLGLAASVGQDLLGALAQLQRWPPIPSVAAVPLAVFLLALISPRLLRA